MDEGANTRFAFECVHSHEIVAAAGSVWSPGLTLALAAGGPPASTARQVRCPASPLARLLLTGLVAQVRHH